MKTVESYATDASGQLNDQYIGREFTRWTRAQLISYLNGALTEISSYKPEAFAQQVTLMLQAGARQELPEPHKRLMSLDTNVKSGAGISQADYELFKAFSPYTCCAGGAVFDAQGNVLYDVKSYAINPRAPKSYYVDPPVPHGLIGVTVTAEVYSNPPQYTNDDWGVEVPVEDKYIENILDFMVGRAHDIDQESPMAARNAQMHLQRFYQAMGVKYRIESAHRAGNWNGAVGTGDPRARI